MECNRKCKTFIEGFIALIISILVGIGVAVLYNLSLIPTVLNLILVGLILSGAILVALLVITFLAYILKKCSGLGCKVTSAMKWLLTGATGTFLSTTAAIILGVATVRLAATILVGLSALFFILMIIELVTVIVFTLEKEY